MKFRIALFIIMITLVSSSNSLYAQYIEQVEEITAGNQFGYGARQMSMGGAGMLLNDGTALFYNPANLARIPRIEINLGISHQKFTDKSSVRDVRRLVDYTGVITQSQVLTPRFEGFGALAGEAENDKSNTRLNSAILTVPYPTFRGSMVFGIGMVRTTGFDRVFRLYHEDTSAAGNIVEYANEFQSGGLTQWGAGFGVDLSPRLSFGAGFYMYTGRHEYNWEYLWDSLGNSFGKEDYITDDYLGWNLKTGLTMQVLPQLGLALAVETPLTLSIDEDVSTTYVGDETIYVDYSEYDIRRPLSLSGGLSLRAGEALFLADIDYTDWSQMEYDNNPDMEIYNNNIKDYYRDVLRWRLGGEYVIPHLGLSLRAGYFSDPLPVKDQFIETNRHGFSLGFGLLVDQVVTIDLAFVRTMYERNSDFIYSADYDDNDVLLGTHNLIIDEEVDMNRLYITCAYRL